MPPEPSDHSSRDPKRPLYWHRVSISRVFCTIALALGVLEGCSDFSEETEGTPPRDSARIASGEFKKGVDRAKNWEILEPLLAVRVQSVPRTKAALTSFFEDWLGPSEPAALDRCKHLAQWALAPQPIDHDVFCYLLEDKDGFKNFLVVDFRSPEQLRVDVATVLEAPSSRELPPTEAESAIAKQVGAVEVNVSGAADDGGPKPGWSIWFKSSEATPEHMRQACRLPKLVAVLLTGKGVTNEWLMPLKGHPYVASIHLFETSVTDEGLAQLGSLSTLKFVLLQDCPVTDQGIAALNAALPRCRVERK